MEDKTIFRLPGKTPLLSLNDRLHFRAKAEKTKTLRTMAYVFFSGHPEAEKVRVELKWYVSDGRRRDAENPVATLKPLCDGIVDAGVVPDDTPEFMEKLMPEIVYEPPRIADPRVELILTYLR